MLRQTTYGIIIILFAVFCCFTACAKKPNKDFSFQDQNGNTNVNDAEPVEGSDAEILLDDLIDFATNSWFKGEMIPYTPFTTIVDGKHRLERLQVAYEGIHMLEPVNYGLMVEVDDWNELVVDTGWIFFTDYNFDGFMDIGFDNNMSSSSMNPKNVIYIFYPDEQRYEYHEEISNITNLSVDDQKNLIEQHYVGRQGAYAILRFNWVSNRLNRVYHELLEYDDEMDNYTKTIKTLKSDGSWETKSEVLSFSDIMGDEH